MANNESARFFTNQQHVDDHQHAGSSSSLCGSSNKEHWKSVARELMDKCLEKVVSSSDNGEESSSTLGTLYTGALGPLVYLKWRMARMQRAENNNPEESSSEEATTQLFQQALSVVDQKLDSFAKVSKSSADNSSSPLTVKKSQQPSKQTTVSLLEGSYVGCKAMAAVLHFELDEKEVATKLANELIEQLYDACLDLAADECDVLYGRAGALQAILFLRHGLQDENLGSNVMLDLVRSILWRGDDIAFVCNIPGMPLLWVWHLQYYLGAAHGVVGILQMILSLRTDELQVLESEGYLQKISETIDGLDSFCFSSGNLDSSIQEELGHGQRHDRLVHWCHGAPGHVLLLVKAASVFHNVLYLEKAKKIAQNVVWVRGLLRKGVGLCHGIAGNAYSLLAIGRHDASFQSKACYFAEFALSKLDKLEELPDHPYSLFEGLGGLCCLAMDLVTPDQARFPLYEF